MKTVIFDFDGTLTKKNNEIWRNIWAELDALDIDDFLYNQYEQGILNYETWCKEIEKVFIDKKLTKNMLDKLINKIEMMDGYEETLKYFKDKGYMLCIVSGGIDYVIYSLLKDNVKYFKDIKCCMFSFDEQGKLNGITQTDSDEEGKARYILKYMKETNSKPEEIIFVGNGHNDRYVSKTGCHTICINPNNTNHNDKNIWHYYIYQTYNLKNIIKLVDNIYASTKLKK